VGKSTHPRPRPVELVGEGGGVPTVVDDEVGFGQPVFPTGLATHASQRIIASQSTKANESINGNINGCIDHQYTGDRVATRLDEQWDIQHDDPVGLPLGQDTTADLAIDRRVHDGVQVRERVRVAEHDPRQLRTVELTGLCEHRVETLGDGGKNRLAGLLKLARDPVGIDDDRATFTQQRRHRRLAGTDSTGEPDHDHRSDDTHSESVSSGRWVWVFGFGQLVRPAGDRPVFQSGSTVPLIGALRWGGLVLSVTLAVAQGLPIGQQAWALPLLAVALWRLRSPIRWSGTTIDRLRIVNEFLLASLVVLMTGVWESPFSFTLVSGVVAVAIVERRRSTLTLIALCSVVMQLASWLSSDGLTRTDARSAVQWSGMLVLVGLVANAAKRLPAETDAAAEARRRRRVANELLRSLANVTPNLPGALDVDEVATGWLDAIRVAQPHLGAVAILLVDEMTHIAHPLAATGPLWPSATSLSDVDFGVVRLGKQSFPLTVDDRVVGVIVLVTDSPVDPSTLTAVGGLDELALDLDNARTLGSLRQLGAEQERSRIARELHDRVGQSLASVGFELDRILRVADGIEDDGQRRRIHAPLSDLRSELTTVVGDVRDALHDLRAEVTVERSAGAVLSDFLDRVEARTGLVTTLSATEGHRPALSVERELVGITKEAVSNVERHARATGVSVVWIANQDRVFVEITDTGTGFDVTRLDRPGSYGVRGMRERAVAVGADLTITGTPSGGCCVRVKMQTTPADRRGDGNQTAAR
jgi:signal transduction histidine kinase